MTKRPKLIYDKNLDPDHLAVVCHLKGKLVACHSGYELLEDICHEIGDGMKNIVLELSGLSRITSSGIGILAAMYTSSNCHGGKLVLVGVDDHLQHHLEVVQIWSMLDSAATIQEALAGLPVSSTAQA